MYKMKCQVKRWELGMQKAERADCWKSVTSPGHFSRAEFFWRPKPLPLLASLMVNPALRSRSRSGHSTANQDIVVTWNTTGSGSLWCNYFISRHAQAYVHAIHCSILSKLMSAYRSHGFANNYWPICTTLHAEFLLYLLYVYFMFPLLCLNSV